jgi:hypothetical protein
MTEPRHIATILGYHQLLATIRARKEELKMSDKDLDNVAGLATGHWSKIISGRKSLGPLSLGRILRGVGLKLIAQEDVEGTVKIAELYLPRAEQQVRHRNNTTMLIGNPLPWLFTSRKARQLRTNYLKRTTPEQRSRTAKKAWRSRRRRQRATRATASCAKPKVIAEPRAG